MGVLGPRDCIDGVVLGRPSWDFAKGDWLRVLVPPIAFWLWTMLQPISAFDALGLGWDATMRGIIALIGALLLLAATKALDPDSRS
jgi:hypothetical protein